MHLQPLVFCSLSGGMQSRPAGAGNLGETHVDMIGNRWALLIAHSEPDLKSPWDLAGLMSS